MHRLRPTSLLAAVLLASAVTAQTNVQKYGNTEKITADRLRIHLDFIASDLLEGRDSPSRGLDIAAAYIVSHLKLWGVKPGGEDGTFLQAMPMSRRVFNPNDATLSIGGESATIGTDYIPRSLATVDIKGAQVVFVPSGYVNTTTSVDPFKGVDVKGKVVLTDGRLPQGVTMRTMRQSDDWKSPEQAAKDAGAVAVVYLTQSQGGQQWERQLANMANSRFSVARNDEETVPSINVNRDVAASLVDGLTAEEGATPTVKPGMTLDLKLDVQTETVNTYNVIGIVEGTDPTLKSEYVALGCHYDHVGIGAPDEHGDTIYNGADDDGSGTVALLEIAHALQTGAKPKRSVLFVWHTAEEKGLLGSAFYVNNPTVPLNKIVSQVNIDMIGRSKQPGDTSAANRDLSGPNEIYAIGPQIVGKRMAEMVEAVNKDMDGFSLNYRYDKVDEPNQFFFRSDHVNYVRKGIPSVFLFSGVHDQYHRPGDHVDTIDFNKLQNVTRLLMGITFSIGTTDRVPTIENDLGLDG